MSACLPLRQQYEAPLDHLRYCFRFEPVQTSVRDPGSARIEDNVTGWSTPWVMVEALARRAWRENVHHAKTGLTPVSDSRVGRRWSGMGVGGLVRVTTNPPAPFKADGDGKDTQDVRSGPP